MYNGINLTFGAAAPKQDLLDQNQALLSILYEKIMSKFKIGEEESIINVILDERKQKTKNNIKTIIVCFTLTLMISSNVKK